MSASRVALSGMRSNASARHISATPSSLDSAYSRTSPSTPPRCCLARNALANFRAVLRATVDAAAERVAASISGGRHCGSVLRQAAVIAARRLVCACTSCRKAANGNSGPGSLGIFKNPLGTSRSRNGAHPRKDAILRTLAFYNTAMSGGSVFPAERHASDHRHQKRDDKQDEGERGAEGPVAGAAELVVDGRRHHLESWSAEQDRSRIGVHAQDEHKHAAGHDAGRGQRRCKNVAARTNNIASG